MKIATYLYEGLEGLGFVVGKWIYPISKTNPTYPATMAQFLDGGAESMQILQESYDRITTSKQNHEGTLAIEEVSFMAPVPHPKSLRDAYAFRQHVATSRRNRGLDMIPEFDKFPVFYFSNHQAIVGPGDVYCMPQHFEKLDFELEVAIVINKRGKNIAAKDADQYIAGYMIMNDFSARALQMEEMKLSLGPAKGKDFATAIGPWLVTKDELLPFKIPAPTGHIGDAYNLQMTCSINGIQVSKGSFADMHWTFAEIIERISYGVEIYPGDVIGSGTVGTGCFLELNGTGKLHSPNYTEQWLSEGDEVTLEVTGLGQLHNTLVLQS
ncbi:fumarylacetoacetate hydrolase family protein [Sphingobacterium sp. SYP-B4668]|uniref:fumarylacetoacetate hydrolase family protein n=1 Tax=Sphingobacterium sp. SYP-B4668 TaxID=2996035 RepID=UPI0022DE8588|nr:fumarylacetoacetate hydrolase family protein [Sphingobacterium sp. SYP-B4668]